MTVQKVPLEHVEQSLYFSWLASEMPTINAQTFAIPNGSYKSKAAAAKFKREGLKPGVLDIFMAIPIVQYNGLFIEMKRQKGGRVEPDQKVWIHNLRRAGYKVEVCRGFEAAKKVTLEYLSIKYNIKQEGRAWDKVGEMKQMV